MTGQKFAEGRTDKKQIWQHGSYEEMKKVSLCFVCCGFRPPAAGSQQRLTETRAKPSTYPSNNHALGLST